LNAAQSPKEQLRTQWHRWLDSRSPQAACFSLNRKNLYTFPSTAGFVFIGLTLVLWLLGTNYQNNLILGLAYGLISVFVVAILHTYANLASLEVRCLANTPVFAGETASVRLALRTPRRLGSDSLQLRFQNGPLQHLSLPSQTAVITDVTLPSTTRGYLKPGRLLVQSYYPLGIIRCWTWLHLDTQVLIYPRAQPGALQPNAQSTQEEGAETRSGGEDFAGLRAYQAGDPIKHIAWKQYAQEKGLFSKEYQQTQTHDHWLDWEQSSAPAEQRLQHLCYAALQLHQAGSTFGLRLPRLTLAPGQGDAHLHQVLAALALFES
jgi:uncharacterized protein (DUF58 family)